MAISLSGYLLASAPDLTISSFMFHRTSNTSPVKLISLCRLASLCVWLSQISFPQILFSHGVPQLKSFSCFTLRIEANSPSNTCKCAHAYSCTHINTCVHAHHAILSKGWGETPNCRPFTRKAQDTLWDWHDSL